MCILFENTANAGCCCCYDFIFFFEMCTNFFLLLSFIPLFINFVQYIWSGLFHSSSKITQKFKWECCFIDFSRAVLWTMWMGLLVLNKPYCKINKTSFFSVALGFFSLRIWFVFCLGSFYFLLLVFVFRYQNGKILIFNFFFWLILLECLVWPARKKKKNETM